MNPRTTTPASAITKQAASKQTYYTIRFLVDRDRIDDAYRAYGEHGENDQDRNPSPKEKQA